MSSSPRPGEVMALGNIVNDKGQSTNHQHQHRHHVPHAAGLQIPQVHDLETESGMEHIGSPHGSDNSRISGPRSALDPLDGLRYASSPSVMHAPLGYPDSRLSPAPMVLPSITHDMANVPSPYPFQPPEASRQGPNHAMAKSYNCATCVKAFSRRSDLARHERIHSGVRPHVCEYLNCGKRFIQRSALTVHQRVHTGEKPHICDSCGKKFSDSSSLARHRRIHSGTRPYKCPYADCQKTFTRRTTLTRHQNHHTGTVEEAAAATAAALASRAPHPKISHARSESDHLSSHCSPMSTPSPSQRDISMSPSLDMAAHSLQRVHNEYAYLGSNSIPAHMRGGHVGSPASTPSPSAGHMRPTSHPTSYGPPPTLEPNVEARSGSASACGSPHLGSVGWQSPSHLSSPAHSPGASSYLYHDADAYPHHHHYYNNTGGQVRRTQSTEPGMVPML